ncbi:Arginase/deacetylase [Suillus decipiens]|nr:Arginase/deacetylase [Suillus decipiens]
MSSAPSNKFLPSPKTVALREHSNGCCTRATSKLGVDRVLFISSRQGSLNQVEELGWHVVFDRHHQYEDISHPPDGTQVNATTDPAVDALSPRAETISGTLRASRLHWFAGRGQGEKEILEKHRIKASSMHEVDHYGIGKLALDHVNLQRDCPIHLSFDVDALDPSVASCTGTPVRGGFTFREGHYIREAVHETGLLVALDLMEVKPTLADAGSVHQTVTVGCSLVRSALGTIYNAKPFSELQVSNNFYEPNYRVYNVQ